MRPYISFAQAVENAGSRVRFHPGSPTLVVLSKLLLNCTHRRASMLLVPDQTVADISKMEWAPLKLEGLPPGIEIVVLRGDLTKGGGEILLRTPPKYIVPNHSHTSDELYVWLKGAFTYITAAATRQKMEAPEYISLPGQSAHALECGDEPCVFYLRYGRPSDLHIRTMPASK